MLSSVTQAALSFLSPHAINLVKTYSTPRIYLGFGMFGSYKNKDEEIWRIGYNSERLYGKYVKFNQKANQSTIENQLVKDLKEFAKLVEHYVIMPLNQNKKAAVLSYAYSVGIQNFKECNLLKLINTRATKDKIIKEWSPLINPIYVGSSDILKARRRSELNIYFAADKEVPLLVKHNCKLNKCLLNIAENFNGTPTQVKAIEYLEGKIFGWDQTGEVMKRFFRLWSQPQGGLGSPRNFGCSQIDQEEKVLDRLYKEFLQDS